MSAQNETRKLVIMITRGPDDERSSVAWSVANGGINNGLELVIFLTSSGVEWARKGVAEKARPNPLDPPIKDMMQTVLDSGAGFFVCPPCAHVRGIDESNIIDGATIMGSTAIHVPIKEGAATLCF